MHSDCKPRSKEWEERRLEFQLNMCAFRFEIEAEKEKKVLEKRIKRLEKIFLNTSPSFAKDMIALNIIRSYDRLTKLTKLLGGLKCLES